MGAWINNFMKIDISRFMIRTDYMHSNRPRGHQWLNHNTPAQLFNQRFHIPRMAYGHTSQWHPPIPLKPPNPCQFLDPNLFRLNFTPYPNTPSRIFQQPTYSQQFSLKTHPNTRKSRIFLKTKATRKPHQKNRNHRGKLESSTLNPSDPLNLQDLMKETERRRVAGLSPLRGDSKMNTPAASLAGESPYDPAKLGTALTESIRLMEMNDATQIKNVINSKSPIKRLQSNLSEKTLVGKIRRRYNNRIPKTGNYTNYYSRRDPKERLQYLMSEWFTGKDIADYGCHNGTMTFAILEKFPDVNRIDALDCDGELIANARHMQRERIRWNPSDQKYKKINFQTANWIDAKVTIDEPIYDTIIAFSVTKWIHLNHGDVGLMRFFRRAFNLLKPGGHLILEPQPRASYKRTRFTSVQLSNYHSLCIDPSNLEPLLLDLGFSYFDTIKMPQPNQPFKRCIMLCSKSYGATPTSIRNDCRDETARQVNVSQLSSQTTHPPTSNSPVLIREPPPVNYCPQTPNYVLSPLSPSSYQNYQISMSSDLVVQLSPDEGIKVESSASVTEVGILHPASPMRQNQSSLNRILFVAQENLQGTSTAHVSPDTTTSLYSGLSPST